MDTSALTNIPPKRLAIIAIGGVGGGLLWRHFSSKKAGTVATTATGDPIDLSKLALEQNSAGNLGAAQTQAIPNLNDATRDLGSGFFPIPVTMGITRGNDGKDYYVDATGKILGPVVAGASPPSVPNVPSTDQVSALQAFYDAQPMSFHRDHKIVNGHLVMTTAAEKAAYDNSPSRNYV